MAGFNKELALKSASAGMKQRIFVGANQHCGFHAAGTKKGDLLLSLRRLRTGNWTSSQCCDGRLYELLTRQLL